MLCTLLEQPVLSDDTVAGFLESIYGRTNVRYIFAEAPKVQVFLCRVVW